MQQIFVNEPVSSDNTIRVEGDDAKHLIKVCRIRSGEKVRVSTAGEDSYICTVDRVGSSDLLLIIDCAAHSTELPSRIRLYQAIPKGERMKTIIEKCVELGVHEIVPVNMSRCVVNLDDNRKAKRRERYQSIARAAAMQSKRSVVPIVGSVIDFDDAFNAALSSDIIIVPYENANGMQATIEAINDIVWAKDISIFIGPEGGFAPAEIERLMQPRQSRIISLGSRILRTDTAAICTMSLIMLQLEQYILKTEE